MGLKWAVILHKIEMKRREKRQEKEQEKTLESVLNPSIIRTE